MEGPETPTSRETSLDETKAIPQRRKSALMSQLEIDVTDKVTTPSSGPLVLHEPSLHKTKTLMRQLEIDMTEKVKSPLPTPENASLSRYGRARKVRCLDSPPENASRRPAKSPKMSQRSASPARSPTVYKMNASNSPVKVVASTSTVLDPINDLLKQNKSLGRLSAEASPTNIYTRRKSVQNREEKTGSLLKCMFSPVKAKSPHNSTRLNVILQRSPDNFDIEPVEPSTSEKKVILKGAVKKFGSPIPMKCESKSPKVNEAEKKRLSPRQQGLIEHPSVIKTLDFNDSPKVTKMEKPSEKKIPAQPVVSYTYDPEYEEMEKNCKFQANDLAWARVGTYPFWPCLITRDPYTGRIVKQKGSSRSRPVQLMHVSYLADNGRRGWISVGMLREFHGLREFEEARAAITPEQKKKDPKLCAAFFISEKSRFTWDLAVKEAEVLLAKPNFSRIDVLYEMVYKPYRQTSKEVVTNMQQKEKKRNSNENRRISLSASLLDTLFSVGPSKTDEKDKSKSTFDVSDVVTACLDDMATKTGNIKIQKQSHMDRWLQKAKSKTPEKAVENAKIAAQNTRSRKKKRDGTSDDSNVSKPAKRRLRSSSKYSLRTDSSSGLDSEESKTNSLDEKLLRVSGSTEMNQRENCSPVLSVETHEEQAFVPLIENKIDKDNACSHETGSKKSDNNKKNCKPVVADPKDDKNTEQEIAKPESECSTDNDDVNITLKMEENSFDSDVSPIIKNPEVTNAKEHEIIDPLNVIDRNKVSHFNNDHTYGDKPDSGGNANLCNLNKNLQNEKQNTVESFLIEPENADESSVSSSSMSVEGPMYIAIVVENSSESFGDSQSSVSIKNTEIDAKCQAVSVKNTISTIGAKITNEINNFGNESQHSPNLVNNHIEFKVDNENIKASSNDAKEVISQLNGEDVASNRSIEDYDRRSVESLDISTVKDNVSATENHCERDSDVESRGNTIIISDNIQNDHNYFHMTAKVSLVKCAIKEGKLEEIVQFKATSEVDNKSEDLEEKLETLTPVSNFISCNENLLAKRSSIDTLHMKSDSITENSNYVQTKNSINLQREQTIESSEILKIKNTIQSNEIGSTKQDFVDFEPDSDTERGKGNNHFLDVLSENSSSSDSEILKNTKQNIITPKLCALLNESYEVNVPSNKFDNMQDGEDAITDTVDPIESNEISDSDSEESPETDSSRPESEIIEKIEVDVKKIRTYLYAEISDVDTRESSIDGETDIRENLESVSIVDRLSTDDSKSTSPCNIESVHCIEQDVKFREKKEIMPANDASSIDEYNCDSTYEAEPANSIHENLESVSAIASPSSDNYKSTSPCKIAAVHSIKQDVKFQGEKDALPLNDTQSIDKSRCDSACEVEPTKVIHNSLESVSIGGSLSADDSKSTSSCNLQVKYCIEQDVKFQQEKEEMPVNDIRSIKECKYDSSHVAEPTNSIHENLESVSSIASLSTNDFKSTSPCNIEAVHSIEQDVKFQEQKDEMPVNEIQRINESKYDNSYVEEPTNRIHEGLESISILGSVSANDSKSASSFNMDVVHCIEQDVKFQKQKDVIPVNRQSINECKYDSPCVAEPTNRINESLESNSILGSLSADDSKSTSSCNMEVVHCVEQDVNFKNEENVMPVNDIQSINKCKYDSSCVAELTNRIHESLESNSIIESLSTSLSTASCNMEVLYCSEQNVKFQEEKDELPVINTHNIIDPKRDSSCEAEPTNSFHENIESIHCIEQNVKFQENKDKFPVNDTHESKCDNLMRQRDSDAECSNRIVGDFKSEESVPANNASETRSPSTHIIGADSKIQERLIVNNSKSGNESNSVKSCDKEIAISFEVDLKIKQKPNSIPSETTGNAAKSDTTSNSFVIHTNINENAAVCKVNFQSANEIKSSSPLKIGLGKINIENQEKVDHSTYDSNRDLSCDIIPKNRIENNIKIQLNSKVISTNDMMSTDGTESTSLGEVDSEVHLHNTEVFNNSINYKVEPHEPNSTSIEKRTSSRVKAKDKSDVFLEDLQIGRENVTSSPVDATQNKTDTSNYKDPAFMSYVLTKESMLTEKYPNITAEDKMTFLYSLWSLSNDRKHEIEGNIKFENIVEETVKPKRKSRPKEIDFEEIIIPKDKPVRKRAVKTYFENHSDTESELDNERVKTDVGEQTKNEVEGSTKMNKVFEVAMDESTFINELTKPTPNLFKGLVKERLCEICEFPGDIVKCKGHCGGMYHTDCVRRQAEPQPEASRKKKKKQGRPRKNAGDSDQSSDGEKSQDVSLDETNILKSFTVENENFETQLAEKMTEELEKEQNIDLDLYSTDEELDWDDVAPGQCEIVNVELRLRSERKNDDLQYFKCNNCQNYYQSPCFICKSVESPKHKTESRQKCSVMHCQKVYHLECLDHWPQTQFSSGGLNKESEAITCPRHVCHTCVCDDPRGCKTRFSGDKLARCVRCPAVYHSFTKCLPAGTKILNGSHIICPRHYEQKPGKVPYHVNTSWCFICATGGTLICCEYCPMSFHADCLNIQPPEDSYMCEDCETGRLPLYGEMVWAKLGNYRWWPGLILYPHLIPDNVKLLKHSTGEFVVRFFGGNDHFWLYRGRVFPYQEGDTGKCSTQKSKIDTEFIMAVEQAQRTYKMLKEAKDNEVESMDIASSMLPPHYVKLKVNKPHGSLAGRRVDLDEENSGTQCDCRPDDDEPCSAYSQCLNRVLLTECGPTCRAGDRCNNRNFEKRNYPKLAPRRTPQRGWGLHTLEDIKKGQFVIEYVGELIDDEEFRRRMRRKHETRDENYYFLTLDKDRMIDAGPKGNAARFMNHCCEPNCETQKWTVLGDVRVGLFAICDIPANSEVTFNYNLECASVDKKKCLCGAGRCSGYIGAKPKQEEPQLKKPKRKYNKKPRQETPSTSAKTPPVRKYRNSNTSLNASFKSKDMLEIEQDLLIIQNATRDMPSDSELETNKINKEVQPINAEAKDTSVEEIKASSPKTECKKVEDRSPKIVKEAKVKMSFDEEMMKIDDYALKKRKEKKDKTLSPDGKVNVVESPKKKKSDEIVKVNGIEGEKEKIKTSKKTGEEKLEKLKSPDDGHKTNVNGHRKEKKRSHSREKTKEPERVGKLDKVEKKEESSRTTDTFEYPEKRPEQSFEKSVSEDRVKSGGETPDIEVKSSKKTMKQSTLTDGEMNGLGNKKELRVSMERCNLEPYSKEEKKALKRKRVSFSSEEIVISYDESTGEKKTEVKRTEDKNADVKKAKIAGSAYEQVFFEFLKNDTLHEPLPGSITKNRKWK